MTRRIPFKKADEYGAFTSWRKYLHWHAHQLHKIKQRYNRRDRHQARQDIREGKDEQ